MIEIETIVRGRTYEFDLVHYDHYVAEGDPANVVTDHTGWEGVRAQVRNKRTGKVVCNLNAVFPIPSAGTVAIRQDRVFTRSLRPSKAGELWWDMVATDQDGIDHILVYPEPFDISDWPTDPEDNSSNDFIPGGGGAVYHTHPFSQITGFESGIAACSIDADGRLCFTKSGFIYKYEPFSVTPV